MLERFARGSRCRNTNCASGKTSSRNGTRSAFFGVFSSRRTAAPDGGGWPSRSLDSPRETLAHLRDDGRRRVAARQAIRAHDAAARPQRRDALDELVALAADRVHARRLGKRLEQQRAAGARRAQDDDRPLEHGRLVRLGRAVATKGSGSGALATAWIRGTSTVGSSICGSSTVGRLLSVGSSPEVGPGAAPSRPRRTRQLPGADRRRRRASSRAPAHSGLPARCRRCSRPAPAAARAACSATSTRPGELMATLRHSPCRYQSRAPVVAELENSGDELVDGRRGFRPRCPRARGRPERSLGSCSSSDGDITDVTLKRSIRSAGRAAGSKGIRRAFGLRPLEILPAAPAVTSRQNAEVPAVSATRCTRASGVGFSHLVLAPVVEHPGLAGRHVHVLVAAEEPHFGPRDDRDVHAHAVVTSGGSCRCAVAPCRRPRCASGVTATRPCRRTPAPAGGRGSQAAPGSAASRRRRCRSASPPTVIRRTAVLPANSCGWRDQAPRGQRLDLGPQPLRVEADRQAEEGLG